MKIRLLLIAWLALAGACTEDGPPLTASDVEVTRPLPGSGMSAGYLVLHNASRADIVLTRVGSPEFAGVAMHESVVEDGVARMRALESLTVPAGADVVFERGGRHLMLRGPVGNSGTVTLQFYAGDVPILTITTNIED
jgi:copper(I)-binding protein